MVNKKVVLSANTAWYLYNFRESTIRAFIDSGCSVYIVAPYETNYSAKLVELGCVFKRVRVSRSGKNPLTDILTFLNYLAIYIVLRPQVVFNFTPKVNIYSTWAAKLVGARVVNNIAGLGTLFVSMSFASRMAVLLYRYSQPLADFVFFQNEEDIALFRDNGVKIDPVRRKRIPGSGVNLQRFTYSPSPDDGVVRFILVARMLEEKGVVLFVSAARQMLSKYKHLEFYLLGPIDIDNPSAISREEIGRWEAEGVVKYLGVTDDVPTIVAKMDVVVLPSYYREGVPKSLLEAAAMGKLIVTTNSVGCRDVVQDGITGFLCEPRNANSLLLAIEECISLSSSDRALMSRNARDLACAKFSESIVINEYLNKLFS